MLSAILRQHEQGQSEPDDLTPRVGRQKVIKSGLGRGDAIGIMQARFGDIDS